MLSTKCKINVRRINDGKPYHRTTWAQLRAKERKLAKRERLMDAYCRRMMSRNSMYDELTFTTVGK